MAIALVQSIKKVVTGANFTTLAYASNLTAGNLLCNSHTHYSNPTQTITTPTDTLGHTYAGMAAEQSIVFGGDSTKLRSFYKENCSAGANTVTFDIGGATAGALTVVIAEFSGIATASAFGTANTGAATNTAVSGGAVTPGANGALLWGAMTFDGATTTITEGFTGGLVQEDENGDSNNPIGVEWKEQATAASEAATWTLGASRQYIAHTATFVAAAGGGGATPMRRKRMTLMGCN